MSGLLWLLPAKGHLIVVATSAVVFIVSVLTTIQSGDRCSIFESGFLYALLSTLPLFSP